MNSFQHLRAGWLWAVVLAAPLCRVSLAQQPQGQPASDCASCMRVAEDITRAKAILACDYTPAMEDPPGTAIALLKTAIELGNKELVGRMPGLVTEATRIHDSTVQLQNNDWKKAYESASKFHDGHRPDRALEVLSQFGVNTPKCWAKFQILRKAIDDARNRSEELTEGAKGFMDAAKRADRTRKDKDKRQFMVDSYRNALGKFVEARKMNADNAEALKLGHECKNEIDIRTPWCNKWCGMAILAASAAGSWKGYEYYQAHRTIKVSITSGATALGAPQ